MKNIFKIFFMMACFICISYASVYMHKNGDHVSYSDAPFGDSTKVEIPSANSITSNSSSSSENESNTTEVTTHTTSADDPGPQPDKQGKLVYTDLRIVSPKNKENFHNQPEISIQVKVFPKLQIGDKIQLVVDGELWGKPAESTDITLNNITRGTHTISAVLSNDEGKVILSSNMVTTFYHQAVKKTS